MLYLGFSLAYRCDLDSIIRWNKKVKRKRILNGCLNDNLQSLPAYLFVSIIGEQHSHLSLSFYKILVFMVYEDPCNKVSQVILSRVFEGISKEVVNMNNPGIGIILVFLNI